MHLYRVNPYFTALFPLGLRKAFTSADYAAMQIEHHVKMIAAFTILCLYAALHAHTQEKI